MLVSSLTHCVFSSVQVAIQVEFSGQVCNSRSKKAEVCYLEVQFLEVGGVHLAGTDREFCLPHELDTPPVPEMVF